MKKVWSSVWQDITKSKIFNAIIFFEILILIIVCGIVLQNTATQKNLKSNYQKENANAIFLQSDNLDDHLGKEGLTEYGASATKISSDGKVVNVINQMLARIVKVKHSGDWFSDKIDSDVAEVLVQKNQSEYKIGGKYTLNFSDGTSREICVIGYLGKDNLGISLSALLYENLFTQTQMLMLDNLDVADIDNTIVVDNNYDKQFFIDNYNCRVRTYEELFTEYVDFNYTSFYFGYYWIGIISALIVSAILCNSLFQTENNIRSNVAKYIVGLSRTKICISEIIKAILLFIIPFIIDLIAVIFINALTVKPSTPSITFSNFFASSAIVLVIYAVSTLITLIRVINAKPLAEIRK